MVSRRDRRTRRRGENWPNQFEVEPLSVYRQKEGQRTVDLIQSAWKQKGLPPLPTHGSASTLAPPKELREKAERLKAGGQKKQGVGLQQTWQARQPQQPQQPQQQAPAPSYAIPGMPQRSFGGGRTLTPSAPKPTPPGNPILGGLGRMAGGVADIGRGDFREGAGDIAGGGWRAFAGNEPGSEFSKILGMLQTANDTVVGGTLGEFGELERDPVTGELKRRYNPGTFIRGLGRKAQSIYDFDASMEQERKERKLYEEAGIERSKNPLANIARAGQEFGAAEDIPIGARVAAQVALDPSAWVGVGGLGRLPGAAGKVFSGSRLGRLGAGLIESPGEATLLGAAGAGAAAQFGEDIPGFNKLPKTAQMMIGGGLGGMAPGAARAAARKAASITMSDILGDDLAPVAAITKAQRANQQVNPDPEAMQTSYGTSGKLDPEKARTNRYVNEQVKANPVGPKANQPIVSTKQGLLNQAKVALTFGQLKRYSDWVAETEGVFSPEEIRDWADWYDSGGRNFDEVFGEEDAQRWQDGHMLANRRTPVETSLMNTFRGEDIRLGKPQIKGAGTKSMQEAIIGALSGDFVGGIEQKISDFLDSIRRKKTRSWQGDDPAGGEPFVGDVHSMRDAGYIDGVSRDMFGLVGVTDDMLDTPLPKGKNQAASMKPTAQQYETVVNWGNGLKDYLNEIAWQGRTNWTAAQAQAVGWGKMRKLAGYSGGNFQAAIQANTRRISVAVNFGEGSPLAKKYNFAALSPDQQRAVTTEVMERAMEWIKANIGNVNIRHTLDSVGGWLDDPVEPGWQVDVLTSPETAADVADALGYILQQSGIVVSRMQKSGKTRGVDILFRDGTAATDVAYIERLWTALRAKEPGLFRGFYPTQVGDTGGIRMLDLDKTWRGKGESRIWAAVQAVEVELGLPKDSLHMDGGLKFDASFHGNDWKKSGAGRGYLQSLNSRQRSALVGALKNLSAERDGWIDDAFARAGAGPRPQRARRGGAAAAAAAAAGPQPPAGSPLGAAEADLPPPGALEGTEAPLGPADTQSRGLGGRVADLLAKGLPEPEMPGVIRKIGPTEDVYHGAMNGWNPAWGIKGSTTGEIGPGLYTTTEEGLGARGRGLAAGYARNQAFTSGSPEEAMDPTLVTLRAKGGEGADLLSTNEPVLPDEVRRVREVMPDDVREAFDRGLMENASPDGSLTFAQFNRAFRPVADLIDGPVGQRTTSENGQMRMYLRKAGIAGLSSDSERQTQQAWFEPNEDLDITNLERLKPDAPARDFAVSEKEKRRRQMLRLQEEYSEVRGRPGMEEEESRLRTILRAMFEEDQATAGVAPRRQRMAGGGVNDKDYAQMPADEIAQVLGRSPDEVNELWELMRGQREGSLPRDVQKRFDVRKKALRQEYVERFGGNPVRTYELGTRAENYRGIDAAARARGLDPTTETANIGGAYRKAGDPYDGEIIDRAPHERVEGYESDRPTASEAAARQAEDVAAGDMPAPRIEKRERSYGELTDERKRVQTAIDRIEAKRTPENAAQMDKRLGPLQRELEGIETELRAQETGPGAGEAGGIAGRQSIGRGLADAYAPLRSPVGIGVRFGAGYGAAKLEGEDNETALERAIMTAGVGLAARAGLRAGARGANAAERMAAWEGSENIPPRWGNAKTPEELRKRAEQRNANIENLAKGRARQAEQRAAGTAKPRRAPTPTEEAAIDAAAEEMGIPNPASVPPLPRPEGNRLRPEGRTPRTGTRPKSEMIAEQIAKLEEEKVPLETGPEDILRGAERAEGADWRDVGPVPKSVQELRDDPLRRLGERRAIEQQQGVDELTSPGRVAPAATFPEGPESAATTPLGGDFEPAAIEGAGPVDVENPLPRRTPQDDLRAEQELRKVGAERRRVERDHADSLRIATEPAQGIAGEATDIPNKQVTAEEAIAAIPEDDPRLPAIKKMQEAWGEEFKAQEVENPKEGVTSGNWANKLLIEWPTAMSRMMFSLATSGDFGSGFIQSQLLFFTDPVEWKRSMTASLHAWGSQNFREEQRAFNKARIEAAVPEAMRGEIYETAVKGRTITNPDGTTKTGPRLAISTKAGEMSGDFGSPLLERGKYNPTRPYLQAFRRQFETQTEHLRVHAFTEMLETARQLNIKAGKGDILFPHQVDGAINKANHLTGATSGHLNPVLGVAFGAPRFLLSQFAMLQDFVTPGGGTSSAYARRKMIQGFGTVLTATVAANLLQSKGKDWFGPGLGGPDDIKDADDLKDLVTHPNFGRVRVSIPKLGEADVSLFGPFDPMARAFFKETTNLDNILRTGEESAMPGAAAWSVLENKMSAFPRTILNLSSGENRFTGREMDSWQDVLAVELPRIAPIFMQSAEEALSGEGSWTNMLVGYTGHKSSPLSPTEKVNAVMEALPDKYWVVDAESQDFRPPENIWELSAKERSEIRTEYPAVARYLEKLEADPDKPFLQQVAGQFAQNQKRMDTELENGDIYTDAWRERFISNQRQLRDLRDAQEPFDEREITTQREADIDQYFGIYDKPEMLDEEGKLDYSLVEQEIRAFRARVGETRWADIEETLGWNESATVRQYHEDMRNYGDFMSTNSKYEGVPAERTRRADAIAAKVRSVQASIPGTPSKYILGIWRDDGSIDQQEYDDTIIAMGRKYTQEYEDWKETPEGIAALDWFQPVSRTQGFVVPPGTEFEEESGGRVNPYASSEEDGGRRRRRRSRRNRARRTAA